jgi:poly-gamma-glutamate synthesis protein (capsule biosynthesis protein)
VVTGTAKKSIIGILLTTFLIISELVMSRFVRVIPNDFRTEVVEKIDTTVVAVSPDRVRLMVFGDINLGRKTGKKILNGEVNFPFAKIDLKQDSADIVFANLESPLSDQNGETVSPMSNIVFTGPPQGAVSLKNAGFTVVSTANNHSLDYGVTGLRQTIKNLSDAEIFFSGTSIHRDSLYRPLFIAKNNINFLIFAVTTFMNFNPKDWRSHVASVDTGTLGEKIRSLRPSADVVIVSVHGGTEYVSEPDETVRVFSEWCVRNGVDIVLGHHPHVTYGIQRHGRSTVIHSLGNMVFYQPQHVWTQRSYGVKFIIEKTDSVVLIDIEKIIPLKVGFQTERMTDTAALRKLQDRTQSLSNFDVSTYWE